MLEHPNWIDYTILGVILGSIVIGVVRGFVKEAMSLLTWVIAMAVGILYCEPVASLFIRISMIGVRLLLAFVLLVLITLILGGIISHLISRLIKITGFGITDRIIGMIFGAARGMVAISLVILLGSASPMVEKESVWQSSQLVPKFQPMSIWMKEHLPDDLLKKVQF